MRTLLIAMVGLVVAVAVAGMASAAPIVVPVGSTFDSDLDGWTSNTPAEVRWDDGTGNPEGGTGNPGGYVLFEDDSANSTAINAPSKFWGDWSALNGTGSITFDHNVFRFGGGHTVVEYKIYLDGNSLTATWTGPLPSKDDEGVWVHLEASLTASEWGVSEQNWADLLTDVTALRIQIEVVGGTDLILDVDGIDNVRLASTSTMPTLSPWSQLALVAAGLLGAGLGVWRGRTA